MATGVRALFVVVAASALSRVGFAQVTVESKFLPADYAYGRYGDASNWSPAEVPNNTPTRFYNVTLGQRQFVTVDIDPTIHNLTGADSGGLSLFNHSLTVVETARFTRPTIQVSGGTLKAGAFLAGPGGTLTGGYGLLSYSGAPARLQFNGAHITSLLNAQLTLLGTGAGIIDENGSDALRDLAEIDSQSILRLDDHALVVSAPLAIGGTVQLTGDASASTRFTALNGIANFDSGTRTLSGGNFIIRSLSGSQAAPVEFRFAGADIVNNATAIELSNETARIADLSGLDAFRNFARNMAEGQLTLMYLTFLAPRDFTNDGMVKLTSSTFSIAGTLTNFDPATRALNGGSFTLDLNVATNAPKSTLRFVNADIVHNGAFISLSNGAAIVDVAGNDAFRNFTDNLPTGTFVVGTGQTFKAIGTFTNAGRVQTQPPYQIAIPEAPPSPPAGNFSVASGASYVQTSGSTANGGVLSADRIEIRGGSLSGSGTINGNVSLGDAIVYPGGGINGNLSLSAGTRVHSFVDQYSRFSRWGPISGTVALAGKLEVEIRYENYLATTVTFTLLSAKQVSGFFSNAPEGSRITTTDGSGSFIVRYDGTSVKLANFQANPPPPRLLNISTRGLLKSAQNDTFGDSVLTGGFIINGSETKRVVLRGIGPSLAGFGVPSPVQDPRIDLYNADRQVIASNDNWRDAQQPEIATSGLAPTDDRDAAVIAQLVPGAYTVAVRDTKGIGGAALVEVYDLTSSDISKLANISTRGFLDANNPLIGGIIAREGQGNAELVVRAIGPQLRRNGVFNAVDDPMLELRDVNGTLVAANDNWGANYDQIIRELQPAFSSESALHASLPAGNYTAIVRAKGAGQGQALVEFYDLRR